MTDTTVLAVLAAVLSGVGGAGMWIMRSLLSDVLATNRALRQTLVSMGQRFRDHLADDRITADMIEDLHRDRFGKRTSEYTIEREKIRNRENRENREKTKTDPEILA